MTEFVIKLFIFLVGYGMGFITACLGASQIIAEKHDLKVKCARLEAEKEALEKTKVTEIHIPIDPQNIPEFGDESI